MLSSRTLTVRFAFDSFYVLCFCALWRVCDLVVFVCSVFCVLCVVFAFVVFELLVAAACMNNSDEI